MSWLVKGVTAHTGLTDKEVGGVIDHADGSITLAKLVDGILAATAVGRAKMADGFIVLAKLPDGLFTAGAAGRAKFTTGFVDSDLLADDITVNTLVVADGTGHYLQVPTLTTAQRDALAAVNGMIIYNSDTNQLEQYSNGSWEPLPIKGGLMWTKVFDGPSASLTPGDWAPKASLPLPKRYGFAYGAIGSKLYVAFGLTSPPYDGSNYLKICHCYDPSTDSWSAKTEGPDPKRQFPGSAVLSNLLYALGGFDGAMTRDNDCYDPGSNSWTSRADLPTATYGNAGASDGAYIYSMGGAGDQTECQQYDPTGNSWSAMANIPNATEQGGAEFSSVNSRIYLMCGGGGSSGSVDNQEYTPPPGNSWAARTNVPGISREMVAVAEMGNHLYCIGGRRRHLATEYRYKYNEQYDPSADTWASMAEMLDPARGSHGAGVINNVVYCVGGWDLAGYLIDNDAFVGNGFYDLWAGAVLTGDQLFFDMPADVTVELDIEGEFTRPVTGYSTITCVEGDARVSLDTSYDYHLIRIWHGS